MYVGAIPTAVGSSAPTTGRSTRDYHDRDVKLVVVVTIIVVPSILIAPLCLVGSVIVSYLSTVGVGVLVFRIIVRQELHWSVT